MAGLLTFDGGFTSLTSDRMIPQMFNLNSCIHIRWNELNVPWYSLSSLVISLALVNDIPQ
jgi:hypothetical protein